MKKYKLIEDMSIEFYNGEMSGKSGTVRAGTEFIILKMPTPEFKTYLLESLGRYPVRLKIRPNAFKQSFIELSEET